MRGRSAGVRVASRSRGHGRVRLDEVPGCDSLARKGQTAPPRIHTACTATVDVDHGSSRDSSSSSRRPRPHRRQIPAANATSGSSRGGTRTSMARFFPLSRDTYYQDRQMAANAAVESGVVGGRQPDNLWRVVDLEEPRVGAMRHLRRPRPKATR